MNIKRTLIHLYKDIVLVTHICIFYTTWFTNNNIKVVIQMHSFQFDPFRVSCTEDSVEKTDP